MKRIAKRRVVYELRVIGGKSGSWRGEGEMESREIL